MKLYGEISKTEELDDGTIKVWGYASSAVVDSDGETITADAMKAALPDYMKFGAVREMHQAKAAGTAIEAEVQEDGRTWFGAHVVDSEAVKKVKANVYKGFSIGGKATERDELNKSIIKGLRLVEVSLVDRPANPEAVFTMFKADGVDDAAPTPIDTLAELLNKGEITPERLIELAKADKAQPTTDPIKKSMWSVQDFAGTLMSLGWICRDAQDEAAYEGDGSPVPAALRAWLAQGIKIFQDMAAEECAEMLACLKTAAGEVDVIELAARGSDIAKGGKKFSADTKDKLAKAHKAIQDANDHMAAVGYDADDGEDEGDGTDKVAKGELAKVAAAHDALTKALRDAGCEEGQVMVDFVKGLVASRDDMQKQLATLKAQPAPGKALLKAITKGEDVGNTTPAKEEEAVVKMADGSQNEVASLIKQAHKTGGVLARV
ncbi:hypothetical protein EJD96_00095 (plasmid) [Herbaspirillum seropedicae]|uniref:hypothetical protein n=1 Tax=Herbaspirillum seropedicae TaxID=964 RepID=UPI00111F90B7|nr:hypothetical protein [Herbaspirillum seropedicae]QDD62654.1 hypothetical protein EJD96_00095 [Herbaspirillum seropedicae]